MAKKANPYQKNFDNEYHLDIYNLSPAAGFDYGKVEPVSVTRDGKIIDNGFVDRNDGLELTLDSNSKLTEKNKLLNFETNQLKQEIEVFKTKINLQASKIEQNNINKEELEFLKLNLIYSSKCQKTIFKKGYKVGTQEYKDCIFRRGKKIND